MQRLFIKAGQDLIPVAEVTRADISDVENGVVDIFCGAERRRLEGFDALEAVMLLNPSALEGRRLRWMKNAWAFHNLVAHPVMQVLVWLGFKKAAIRLHDATVPKPVGFRVLNN